MFIKSSGLRFPFIFAPLLAALAALPLSFGCSSNGAEYAGDREPLAENWLDTPPDPAPPTTASPRPSFARLRISARVDADHYATELAQSGDTMVGTRTLTYADGSLESEAIEYPIADLIGGTLDETLASPVFEGLSVLSATATADGTEYVLQSELGVEVEIEISGNPDYLPVSSPLAHLGAPLALIALCGSVRYDAIRSCESSNACWRYSSSPTRHASVCNGECITC